MMSNDYWADDEAVLEDDDGVQTDQELADVLVPVEEGEPPGGCRVLCSVQDVVGIAHRRRIYTEEKSKVVAAVCVTEFVQFLAALAILHQDNLKNRWNSSFSSYHPGAKLWRDVWLGDKELNGFCPSNSSDDLCLLFCPKPSSMV